MVAAILLVSCGGDEDSGLLRVAVAQEPVSLDVMITSSVSGRNIAVGNVYERLFEMDGVELVFEDDALVEIAKKAIERKTGARGLRAICEEVMLDIMYDIPSRTDVKRCIITKDVIDKIAPPRFELTAAEPAAALPEGNAV